MGREGAVLAPQAKACPPRTIFLAPALSARVIDADANTMPIGY